MVAKLFIDVVTQLRPDLAALGPQPQAAGTPLRLTHEQGNQLLELAVQPRCMRAMRARAARSFEVKAAAQDRYVAAMTARGQGSVFVQPSCAGSFSYYIDRHGHPSLVRPMAAAEGLLRHRFFPLRDYRFER